MTLPIPERSFDQPVRLRRVGKRQDPVDQNAPAALAEVFQAQLHVGGEHLAEGADDRVLEKVEALHVERNGAAPMAARGDEPAAARKRGEGFREQIGSPMFSKTTLTPTPPVMRFTSSVNPARGN